MGNILLCAGRQSDTAFRFSSTGVAVYSIEELCYYLRHYVEHLDDELISPQLISFIREKLQVPECAAKMERLLENHAGIKDAIVAIMESACYYSEEEVAAVLSEYDLLNSLTPLQRKKRYADKCLEEGKNREAMHVYRNILYSNDNSELDSVEFGNILHNVAILHARSGSFAAAADEFREAYERNEDPRTLKQYIYALKLGHLDEEFNREVAKLAENKLLLDQVENELYYISDTEENSFDYHEYKKLRELRDNGHIAEYYKAADDMLVHLKNKYRLENG